MDYFYKELAMKKHIKTQTISHYKRYSAIAFAALLALTNVTAFAEPTAEKQLESNAGMAVKEQQMMVHLNHSSLEQLVTLKGIGYKKAEAIIAYREQVGAFKSVTELTQVKGIGEKILSDNKARLKIEVK
jgi:competence protein ComEA